MWQILSFNDPSVNLSCFSTISFFTSDYTWILILKCFNLKLTSSNYDICSAFMEESRGESKRMVGQPIKQGEYQLTEDKKGKQKNYQLTPCYQFVDSSPFVTCSSIRRLPISSTKNQVKFCGLTHLPLNGLYQSCLH